MKIFSFKKITALATALFLVAGFFAVPFAVSAAEAEYGWELEERQFANKILNFEVFSLSQEEISVTLDGAELTGGESVQSSGRFQKRYSVDTTAYADGEKLFELSLGGASVMRKTILFDNTAPYIKSWTAIDPLGHKYTAYDMEVVPDDIIVLSEDQSFTIDFNPTEEGSGMAYITAVLDGRDIPVPFSVDYDYIPRGFHTLSYTLADKAGNTKTSSLKFETRKPSPEYEDMKVEKIDGGYRLSSKVSGSFSTCDAKFSIAEILSVSGKENVTNGDISDLHPSGERDFRSRTEGGYLTETTKGGELYQCFNVDVSGKKGKIYADYAGELNRGDTAEIYLFSAATGSWELMQKRTCVSGTVSFSIGKRGVNIEDYSDGVTLPVRVRVVSDNNSKYLKTLSFVPGIRYNSPVGNGMSGTNGGTLSTNYFGAVTESTGWYITAEADLYKSYSPICDFSVAPKKTLHFEQFSTVFSGNTSTRLSLTWQTAEESKTHVQLLPYGNIYPDFSSSSAKSYTGNTRYNEATGKYVHKLRLTGLSAGAKYWIRYGDRTLDEWSEPCVAEMPSDDDKFCFAAASCERGGDLGNSWSEAFFGYSPSFILTTGDEAVGETEWKEYFNFFSLVFNNIRTVPTAGASDSTVWWTKYNIAEQGGAGHKTGVYYSFKHKNAFFAVLNSNDLDVAGELNAAQLSWADKVFAADKSDWKFLLLNAHVCGADTPLARQIEPLLKEWGVHAVFTSGGLGLSGETGTETVSYRGADCFTNADVMSVSALPAGEDMTVAEIDGHRLTLRCNGRTVNILSTARFDDINARIAALPAPSDITLESLDEVRAIRALYNLSERELAERFVTGIDVLAAAEAALDGIIAVTPPAITVSGTIPKKAVLGNSFTPPAATAEDMTDGAVKVKISVTDPDGAEALNNGAVKFEKYGVYRIVYHATDSDGNNSETVFETEVREFTRFDLNNDGLVTVGDALTALRLAVRILTADSLDVAIADADGDGEITVSDAMHILETAIGIHEC